MARVLKAQVAPAQGVCGRAQGCRLLFQGGNPGPHAIQGIGAGFIPKNLDTSLLDGVIQVEADRNGICPPVRRQGRAAGGHQQRCDAGRHRTKTAGSASQHARAGLQLRHGRALPVDRRIPAGLITHPRSGIRSWRPAGAKRLHWPLFSYSRASMSSYRPTSARRSRPAVTAAQPPAVANKAATPLGWMHTARFLTSTAAQLDQLPPLDVPEIAFVGRSNAGKSTCINTLTQQRQLAFASKTPGRTQHINLFVLGKQGITDAVLADLPGYGYAAVPLGRQATLAAGHGQLPAPTCQSDRNCHAVRRPPGSDRTGRTATRSYPPARGTGLRFPGTADQSRQADPQRSGQDTDITGYRLVAGTPCCFPR